MAPLRPDEVEGDDANLYHLPNLKIVSHRCKTNMQSATAFRGFGGPQGMFADVDGFDPGADRWLRLGAMPVPRHGTGAAVVAGRIHVPTGADVIGFGTTPHHDAFTPPATP